MIGGIALTAIFVVLNGFFVTAEFALVKLRATEIDRLGRSASLTARTAVEICRKLDRYLSATQLGITLASLGLGSVAEPRVAASLEALTRSFGWGESTRHQLAHALSFALLTSAHILFGELLPKLIAIRSAEQTALAASLPLKAFYHVSAPALWILNGLSGILLRAMGFPKTAAPEGAMSEEEILHIIAQSYARGRLSDDKRMLIERVMRFSDATVRQVMVPRVDVSFIDANDNLDAAIRHAQQVGFTRYPVVEARNLDKVVGYVNVKDLTLLRLTDTTIRRAMRTSLVVPESMALFELMREMQRTQTPLAIVVDEYGGTSGIATLEDVLEQIVGEIRDEHDDEIPAVQPRGDGTFVADGLAVMSDLRAVGVDLGDDVADTLGGVVADTLGRLPRRGDIARVGPWEILVENLRRRRVGRVLIRPRKLTERPPPADSSEPTS